MNLEKIINAKRIMIIGNSSAGKSTLAHQLSGKLNIPVHHLDIYAHEPHSKWIRTPKEQFKKIHWKLIQNKRWIVEGNYSSTMESRLQKSDLVIFININRFSSLFNYFKRCTLNRTHFGSPDGTKEYINRKMIKYILIEYPKKSKLFKKTLQHENKMIYINSFAKLLKFKNNIGLATKNI